MVTLGKRGSHASKTAAAYVRERDMVGKLFGDRRALPGNARAVIPELSSVSLGTTPPHVDRICSKCQTEKPRKAPASKK